MGLMGRMGPMGGISGWVAPRRDPTLPLGESGIAALAARVERDGDELPWRGLVELGNDLEGCESTDGDAVDHTADD